MAATHHRLEEELFAAVCASLDDDGPRRVYADFLQSQGELLGETIARMLDQGPLPAALSPRKIVDVTLDPSERARLTARLLGEDMDPDNVGFWRGFPRSLWLTNRRPLPEPSERWGTIEQVSLALAMPDDRALAWLPKLARLPHLRTVVLLPEPSEAAPRWLTDALPPLLSLRLAELSVPAEIWMPEHGTATRGAGLQRLWWSTREWLGQALSQFGPLEADELGIYTERGNTFGFEMVAAAAEQIPAPIARIIGTSSWFRSIPNRPDPWLIVERGEGGRFLHARLTGFDLGNMEYLAGSMARIARDRFVSLTLESPDHADPEFQGRVRRALARFRRSSIEIVAPVSLQPGR